MARDDAGAAGTIVVSFVLGAITGATVALLMAPSTGEEMRRKLGDKAREGRELFRHHHDRLERGATRAFRLFVDGLERGG